MYCDSFAIEKVRIKNSEYGGEKNSIECYLDFSEIALLSADCLSGRLFKELATTKKVVSRGGSKSSKNYNGAPESRIMALGMVENKIFINMSTGRGRLSDTGAILPDGAPDKTVNVGMDADTFRAMIYYTHDCVNAYLASFINRLVKDSEESRKTFTAKRA